MTDVVTTVTRKKEKAFIFLSKVPLPQSGWE